MSPKNIDETIQKLLCEYAKYCESIVKKKATNLLKTKYKNVQDYAEAMQKQAELELALKFLLEVAKEPKKYLYSGENLFYTELSDGKSLYDKLAPLTFNDFDNGQSQRLLVELIESIAHHVKYGVNRDSKGWVYYGVQPDMDAEAILIMNKTVHLWNTNALGALFKDIVPAYVFAVDAYHKK